MTAGSRHKAPERGAPGEPRTSSIDRDPLQPGRLIGGRYRLERPLGRAVWLATAGGRRFALKTGPKPLIEREHGIVSASIHPNVVRVEELVESGAGPIIVFEYLPGGDLVSLAGLAPAHWLGAVGGVVAALGCLHGRGYVHRDLKARNVMFDAAGRARLIDFGSAAGIGSPFTEAGTTAVAVPPGRGGRAVAAADDVYALAVLLHELIHGALPGMGRRRTAAGALAAEVDACLAEPGAGGRNRLERFSTVIESLLEKTRA